MEALLKEMRPTRLHIQAAESAIEEYEIWRSLGKHLPLPGGTDAQEVEWMDAVMCVQRAYRQAEDEAYRRREERNADKHPSPGGGEGPAGGRRRVIVAP